MLRTYRTTDVPTRIEESLKVIEKVAKDTGKVPLVVNFSGGKDSLLLLDLVQRVINHFICVFCITGIEFPDVKKEVEKTAKERNLKVYFTTPDCYKGDFFERLKKFKHFPRLGLTWCKRDLKFRPQKKFLIKMFGKSVHLYKLNGVRRQESSRRKYLYSDKGFVVKDYEVSGDYIVYPILNWSDEERDEYIKMRKIKIETEHLYQDFQVSGCYWCPFYQPEIYLKILRKLPNLYDKIIEWENKLNQPSVGGNIWLSDLKAQVLNETNKGLNKYPMWRIQSRLNKTLKVENKLKV